MTQPRIIDGRHWATVLEAEVRAEVDARVARGLARPGLTVIMVGDDPASAIYVRNKGKACERVGFVSNQIHLPESTPEAELLARIDVLNADPSVHGILVQMPVPAHIDSQRVLEAISPAKDADGFHPINAGRLLQGRPSIVPATPAAIMELLRREGIATSGRHAVVIGRSAIVGRPVAALLTTADATVTLCHSKTPDLAAHVARADIVVAAVGRAELVRGDWIKPGAAVIDVGINRGADGKLKGDVAFDEAASRAGWITPVPGGVGPMTIACLIKNTLAAANA